MEPEKRKINRTIHVAEYTHGGPVVMTIFNEGGMAVSHMSFSRGELFQAKKEIERWFNTHSDQCRRCDFDHGPHPEVEVNEVK